MDMENKRVVVRGEEDGEVKKTKRYKLSVTK